MNNKKQKFFESLSVQLNSYIEAEKVIDQFISNDLDAFQGKKTVSACSRKYGQ